MVEGVEELGAEVHRSGLRDPCALRNRQIPVLLEGAAERIAPDVSYRCACGCRIRCAVDLAWHHNILVVYAVAARSESVQIEEGTQATLDTPRRDGRRQRCTRRKSRKVGPVNPLKILKCKGGAIKYCDWRSGLECGDAIERPSVHQSARPVTVQQLRNGQIIVVADNETVWAVKIRDCTLTTRVQEVTVLSQPV